MSEDGMVSSDPQRYLFVVIKSRTGGKAKCGHTVKVVVGEGLTMVPKVRVELLFGQVGKNCFTDQLTVGRFFVSNTETPRAEKHAQQSIDTAGSE